MERQSKQLERQSKELSRARSLAEQGAWQSKELGRARSLAIVEQGRFPHWRHLLGFATPLPPSTGISREDSLIGGIFWALQPHLPPSTGISREDSLIGGIFWALQPHLPPSTGISREDSLIGGIFWALQPHLPPSNVPRILWFSGNTVWLRAYFIFDIV